MTAVQNDHVIETAKALLRRLETTEKHPERLELELRLFLEKNKLLPRALGWSERFLLETLRDAYKRHALHLLAQLRSKAVPSEKLASRIKQVLAEACLAPEDIGSTEDEIEMPRRLYYRQQAERQLKRLKRCDTARSFHQNIGELEHALTKARCTLEDLGSSKEHLVTLKHEAIKLGMIKSLKKLKKYTFDIEEWRYELLSELRCENLTLNDIGSSEAKFDKLLTQAYRTQAMLLLQDFENLAADPTRHCAKLEQALEGASCTLEDLGSSTARIQELTRNAYKRRAATLFKTLSLASNLEEALQHLRFSLEAARCTLGDIGSSDEDLDRRIREAYKQLALKHLEELETTLFTDIEVSPQRYRQTLAELLEKAGCALIDLESSEEELASGLRAAYKRFAEERVERRLRYDEGSMQIIRFALEKADCTLRDIGYSETRLAKWPRGR